MKKIIVAYWHGHKYKELIYEHNQEIQYSELIRNDIINDVLNNGYSVMIRPFNLDDEMIIWVDKGRFGQK